MPEEVLWHFLVVDDRQAIETEEFIAENRVLEAPNRVIVEKCQKFVDALDILVRMRIDLVILDLKDDSISLEEDEKPLAGEIVFEQIRQTRFIPVIFYTAYPQRVLHLENPYVRVVTRGEDRKLRDVIREVFETGLPGLIKHLEEEQRKYMWEHVQRYWQKPTSPYEKTDLTYLLARRLANTLERNSIRRFLAGNNDSGPEENDPTIHPIEIYIFPPTNTKLMSGDILKGNFRGRDGYWIVLTPSCDLEHGKVKDVVLAACFSLSEQPEYKKVQDYIIKKETPSSSARKELEALISNNRNAEVEGKRFQPTRYIFLPETFFIPDLVIDFQALYQIPLSEIKNENRIASLDSPFAGGYIAQFSEYYGRLGTPDVNRDFVYGRIIGSISQEVKN